MLASAGALHAIREIILETKRTPHSGYDGLNNLNGKEYAEYRPKPLKKRYQSEVAREHFYVLFSQYTSVVLATVGSSLLNAMQLANPDSTLLRVETSRWIAVTTLLAGSFIAVLTFFKVHTVLRSKKRFVPRLCDSRRRMGQRYM